MSAAASKQTWQYRRNGPTPDIQKWITLDPEASIRWAVPSSFSAISLGAHGNGDPAALPDAERQMV